MANRTVPGHRTHRESRAEHGPGTSSRLLHPAAPAAAPGRPELLVIAHGLAASVPGWPGLDDGRAGERRWRLMAASDAFVAWIIQWPPGGTIELHDHGGSMGALVVVRGSLSETSLLAGDDGRHVTRTTELTAGSAAAFDVGHVHDVANLGTVPALSVHVYSPRLTTMTYFALSGGRLEPRRSLEVPNGLDP